jgi:hypothetical protein
MSINFTGTGAGLLQMGIGLDGQHLEFWASLGIDQRPRQEPAPVVPAFLPTDRLGLYGRQCLDCHSYFRTNGIAQVMQCPYCGTGSHGSIHEGSFLMPLSYDCRTFVRANKSQTVSLSDGRAAVLDLQMYLNRRPSYLFD